MKLNKLVIASVALALSGVLSTAAAQTNQDEQKVAKMIKQSAGEFGIFKLESNLRQVPKAIASQERIVSVKGAMAVVTSDEAEVITTAGSIVRNLLTGELTTLTGNIILLTEKGADLTALAEQVGMTVESTYSGTDIVVLKIAEGYDLLEAYKVLKASDLVVETQVETSTHDYKAQ